LPAAQSAATLDRKHVGREYCAGAISILSGATKGVMGRLSPRRFDKTVHASIKIEPGKNCAIRLKATGGQSILLVLLFAVEKMP